jgi:diadenosine tetraphosphatase ApaH/serine/threonine PP2A family protein phosphatase
VATAVISDIHGNAVALRRVLEDIEEREISRSVCLGDIIGYGPEPLECLDLVAAHCEWSLLGNHDFAVMYEPTNFNPGAAAAAYWTRAQFDAEADETKRRKRYEFLSTLRVRVAERTSENGAGFDLLAVHGSPRKPISEYIFPDDAVNAPEKLESIMERVDRVCIVGHTHVPGVFTDEPDFYPPEELGEHGYKFLESEKAIINVGSVGQPRDMDPRASYAVLHEDRIEFVRVEYDVTKTQSLIHDIPELNDWFGDRIVEGR